MGTLVSMSTAYEAPRDEALDIDRLVDREEDADQPPVMPPDREEDFEKAERGESRTLSAPQIIPSNPD
jgi:hypothetical protein